MSSLVTIKQKTSSKQKTRRTNRSQEGKVVTTTLTRPDLWLARRSLTDRLELLRDARGGICGCSRCGDEGHGVQLDDQIRGCLASIADCNDRICERPSI